MVQMAKMTKVTLSVARVIFIGRNVEGLHSR